MEITGKVEKYEVQEGNTNGKAWVRYIYTIAGKKYSTFDSDIGKSDIGVGTPVKMVGSQDGKFFNMKTLTKIDEKDIKETVQVQSDSTTNDLLRQILAQLTSM